MSNRPAFPIKRYEVTVDANDVSLTPHICVVDANGVRWDFPIGGAFWFDAKQAEVQPSGNDQGSENRIEVNAKGKPLTGRKELR
jgi:hypothetical protein